MVTEIKVERRPWASTDQFGLNPQEHHVFIRQLFNKRPALLSATEFYGWGNKVEDFRLGLQNNCYPVSWGDGHHRALVYLKESGILPNDIVQIGAGRDASLVLNLLHTFPGSNLRVVEQDPGKVAGAKDTLLKAGYQIDNNVSIEAYDATTLLLNQPEGITDFVEANLLLQHLPERGDNGRNIPPIWDESKRGPFPTLERMLEAVNHTLRPGGIALFGDLAFRDWSHSPVAGYECDLEVSEMVAKAMGYIQFAQRAGWTGRGANPWQGPEVLAEKVEDLTKGNLILVDDLTTSMEFKNVSIDDPFGVVTAYIPPTLGMAISGTRQRFEGVLNANTNNVLEEERKAAIEARTNALRGLETIVWAKGEEYFNIISDRRISTTLPTIYWQAFKRVN